MQKFLIITLITLILSPQTGWAWIREDDPKANQKAHQAAGCIVLGSDSLNHLQEVLGTKKLDCPSLMSQWYRSGLSRSDAEILFNDDIKRRVYTASQGKWLIEYCQSNGLFGPMTCKTSP